MSLPKPLDIVHATDDGPVRLLARHQKDGTWRAELTGAETQSVGTFASHEEAGVYLRQIFYEMFPEHVCNSGCRDEARKTA